MISFLISRNWVLSTPVSGDMLSELGPNLLCQSEKKFAGTRPAQAATSPKAIAKTSSPQQKQNVEYWDLLSAVSVREVVEGNGQRGNIPKVS